MGGLSSTLFDGATIAITSGASGDLATAISGGTLGGRALSDTAHGSAAGLRYFEVEVVSLRSTANSYGVGLCSAASNLTSWVGSDTISDGFWWRDTAGSAVIYANGSTSTGGFSGTEGNAGITISGWVDCATRRIWMRPTDLQVGYPDRAGRPDDGTAQNRTLAGTADIRIALTPARGSSGNANALRLKTRYTQLRLQGSALRGALPWDARSVTLVEDVSGVTNGTTVRWAWFDQARPDLLTIAPTSTGTATVTSGQVSVTVSTALDSGGIGSLLLSNTDGTVIQCRSHYAPAAVS